MVHLSYQHASGKRASLLKRGTFWEIEAAESQACGRIVLSNAHRTLDEVNDSAIKSRRMKEQQRSGGRGLPDGRWILDWEKKLHPRAALLTLFLDLRPRH